MTIAIHRCSSFATLVVLLLLLVVPRNVNAGWPSNMGKQDKEKVEAILNGRLAVPADLEFFVKYKNKRGKRVAKRFARNNRFTSHVKRLRILSLYPRSRKALMKLSESPYIEYVEPQHRFRALPLSGSDERIESKDSHRLLESVEYGIKMVQADQLWELPPPKEQPTICIIDSGYGLGHPDLPGLNHNVTGTSTRSGNWSEDMYGHGTHCAGIIGAIGNNDIGVAGVLNDPNRFKFHIGKSLNRKGDGSEAEMLDAFEGCMDAGAKVITMSFGTEYDSQTIGDACRDAYDKVVLLIAAAGNEGDTAYAYPASFPEVMSVSAVGQNSKVGGFSQYNDQVEIAGPGVDIVSTTTNKNGKRFEYNTWTGTSMATPHTAGVAAAVWSYFPECTNNQIRNVLIRTAKDEKNVGCTVDMGFGIVQAKDAYDLLMERGCNAGDISPVPLSDGAIGGCSQDPFYTPPPTAAPTPFICEEKSFELELQTDDYGDETSWELTDANNKVIGLGGGYRKNTLYSERLCLSSDKYTFTIKDAEGDGICCNHGDGGYSIRYDNKLIKQGGNFGSDDVTTFGEGDNWENQSFQKSPPTTSSSTSEPKVPPNPPPSSKPTMPPTLLQTSPPTKQPTRPPIPSPTSDTTLPPTPLPSSKPTMSPTSPPSPQPTEPPTTSPTPESTGSPTPPPTPEPTHIFPTVLLTSKQTVQCKRSPSPENAILLMQPKVFNPKIGRSVECPNSCLTQYGGFTSKHINSVQYSFCGEGITNTGELKCPESDQWVMLFAIPNVKTIFLLKNVELGLCIPAPDTCSLGDSYTSLRETKLVDCNIAPGLGRNRPALIMFDPAGVPHQSTGSSGLPLRFALPGCSGGRWLSIVRRLECDFSPLIWTVSPMSEWVIGAFRD